LADRAFDLAVSTLEAKKVAVRSSEVQALLAVQTAEHKLESYQVALTQAQDLLQEYLLLKKEGDATELEVEDAQLGVASAENDLFAAWADLYGARLDLLAATS